jgi:hypothetical protein
MDLDYVKQLEEQNDHLTKKLSIMERFYEDARERRATRRYRIEFGVTGSEQSYFTHSLLTHFYTSSIESVKLGIQREIIETLTLSRAVTSHFNTIDIDCDYHFDSTFNVWALDLYKKDIWYYSAFRSYTGHVNQLIEGKPVDWLNIAIREHNAK